MTPKNIHKIFIPQKIFIFLKTPKNIEIQNSEPPKMTRAYVCMQISEYPPGGHGTLHRQNFEPRHQMLCATSKNSAQPAHMRSLIRAFASRLNIL